jgi:transcriptional regulator with XRE-family HTH domain
MRQADLAERLGCSTRSLSQWERDQVEPKACQWPRLRAVLRDRIDPVGVDFPGQLRAGRLRLGLTQEQLADLAGVHERTIRNAERGRFRPSGQTLARLQGILEDLTPDRG